MQVESHGAKIEELEALVKAQAALVEKLGRTWAGELPPLAQLQLSINLARISLMTIAMVFFKATFAVSKIAIQYSLS